MLDLKRLPLDPSGTQRLLDKQVDLSEIRLWGIAPFPSPITLRGTVTEQLGSDYQLSYQAEYTSVQPCARCLAQVERSFAPSFSHYLRDTGEDPHTEDRYIPLRGSQLNLTQMVSTDLLLELEEAPLCSPDCKGLCPVCGGDRNQKTCDCTTHVVADPRFAVLRELLGNMNVKD